MRIERRRSFHYMMLIDFHFGMWSIFLAAKKNLINLSIIINLNHEKSSSLSTTANKSKYNRSKQLIELTFFSSSSSSSCISSFFLFCVLLSTNSLMRWQDNSDLTFQALRPWKTSWNQRIFSIFEFFFIFLFSNINLQSH